MIHVTASTLRFGRGRALAHVTLLGTLVGCSSTPATDDASGASSAQPGMMSAVGTSPSGTQPSAAGAAAKTSPASSGSAGSAQSSAANSGVKSGAAAGSGATAVASASAVASAASAGSSASATTAAGAPASAGAGAAGNNAAAAAAGAGAAGAGMMASAGAGAGDLKSAAAGLSELFLDAPCDSATKAPLADGATCNHPPNTQHIEKMVMFGGESGKKYKVSLRVRGIWEPTNIMGGMRPYEKDKLPFTIGGMVAGGSGSSSDSINYQQYYIEVAEPKQTYWLNDYQYVAHDIHKQDYEAAITVAGGSAIKVVMNDGNEREIANFPKEMFSDVPPYDKMPSLGQSLRLDVVKVEVAQ